MAKALVIGSSVCDCIINVDVLPSREGDAHIRTQHMQIGGCAFNVASTMAGLGANIDFLSPVGQGVYGDFVAGELAQVGLPVMRVPGDNGCCYCFVEADGERTFLSYHGVEYSFQRAWLNRYDLSQYDYVYVCGLEVEEPTGAALVDALGALSQHTTIVFCPGPRVMHIDAARLDQLLSYHPTLHINEQEAALLAGRDDADIHAAMRTIFARTCAPVIVTLGSQGVIAYDGEQWFDSQQQPVTVCDTVGAGDSHIAGFLTGLLAGRGMQESLHIANTVAGEIVQVSGCRLPETVYQQLREQYRLPSMRQ